MNKIDRYNKLSKEALEIRMNCISKFFRNLFISFKSFFLSELDHVIYEYSVTPIKKIIQNFFMIILGASLVALSESFFILPLNIIYGGVSSLAIIFASIPGLNVIPVNVWVFIFTWGFFIIGFFTLGFDFSARSLLYSIFYPIMVSLFSFIISKVDIFNLAKLAGPYPNSLSDASGAFTLVYIVSTVVGGLLTGTGVGLAILSGGSSGGTDVINLILSKFLRIKVGTVSFTVDAILIIIGFFINGRNLIISLLGLITALLCSIMIDKVLTGGNTYYLALVSSKHVEEINNFVNNELGRGTTILYAQGGYSKNEQRILEICFDRKDYSIVKDMIDTIDKDAFTTIIETKEILGYGFSKPSKKGVYKNITADQTRKLIAKARTKRKNTFKE